MLILLTLFGVVLRSPYWNNSQAGASLGSLTGTIMHYLLSSVIINLFFVCELLIAFFLLRMKHVAKGLGS